MEDDLDFFKCKTTIIFSNERQPQFFFPMEDDFNLIQMEYDLNILANGRQPQKKIMQLKTIKFKTMVVAPLRVT